MQRPDGGALRQRAIGLRRRLQRRIAQYLGQRVDAWVDRVDTLQVRLHHLGAGYRARADRLRQILQRATPQLVRQRTTP